MPKFTTNTIKQFLKFHAKDKSHYNEFKTLDVLTSSLNNVVLNDNKNNLYDYITDHINAYYNCKNKQDKHQKLINIIQLTKCLYLLSLLYDNDIFYKDGTSNMEDVDIQIATIRRVHLIQSLCFHTYYILFMNFPNEFKLSSQRSTCEILNYDFEEDSVTEYINEHILNTNVLYVHDMINVLSDVCQINDGLSKNVDNFMKKLKEIKDSNNANMLYSKLCGTMSDSIECGNMLL